MRFLMLLSIALLGCSGVANAQYRNFSNIHHNNFHDVNRVIIEERIVDFDDAGVRVIGVPVNLLDLDYYWSYDYAGQKEESEVKDALQEQKEEQKVLKTLLLDILRRLDEGGKFPSEPQPTPTPTEPSPVNPPNGPPEPVANPLDATIFKLMTDNKCLNCHSGEDVPVWTALNGDKYPVQLDVAPDQIPTELGWALYKSVLGIDANVKRMPKGGKQLTSEQINTFLEWNIARCR